MPHPFKIIDDEIAYLELYDKYIISQIKEDVVFGFDELNWLVMVIDQYYPDNKLRIGYISNRVNKYNLQPTIYKHISLFPKVISLAMVCYTPLSAKNALYEKKFQQKKFEIFSKIEDAIYWTLQQQEK